MRDVFGYLGVMMKALEVEVTWGAEFGHHPHHHVVFCFERALSNQDMQQLMEWVETKYSDAVEKQGYKRPSRAHGVDFERISSREQVSAYLTMMEKADQVAQAEALGKASWEIAGGPTKNGRAGNLSSWQLLEWFADTGDMDAAEAFTDFAAATKGRPALYISPKLKELHLTDPEKTDEELAADEDASGQVRAEIAIELWSRLCRIRGARLGVLEAAERGGLPEVERYLRSLIEGVVQLPGLGSHPPRFILSDASG